MDVDELLIELRSTHYHNDLLHRAANAIEEARSVAASSFAAGYHQRDKEVRHYLEKELLADMPKVAKHVIAMVDARARGLTI